MPWREQPVADGL
jgi:hypothetical protein